MISGPGTKFGISTLLPRAGKTDDLAIPLTTVVISIGYMFAAIEISPTTKPSSTGRPSLFASPSEIRSLPPLMLSTCAAASYS